MLVTTTLLRYPKSENVIDKEQDTCEDAAAIRLEAGVVAVCDGVGSTSFAAIWANVLACHAVAEPLQSTDPFEVEGWLRRAQPAYWQQAPDINTLPSYAKKKARLGGASTLLQLTVMETDQAKDATAATSAISAASAHLQLIAFGDSCALLSRADGAFTSFPYTTPEQFAAVPISLPASPLEFNRDVHRGVESHIEVNPGDLLVCLTDAVALWVLRAPARGVTVGAALQELAAQTPATWPAWIDALRAQAAVVDDDSTAVILRFETEPAVDTSAHAAVQRLVAAPPPKMELLEQRKRALVTALAARDLPAAACAWGDGALLQPYVLDGIPDAHEIEHARAVAKALSTVWWALKHALTLNDSALRLEILEAAWRPSASLLRDEPCAQPLMESLAAQGLQLGEIPAPAIAARADEGPAVTRPAPEHAPENPSLQSLNTAAPSHSSAGTAPAPYDQHVRDQAQTLVDRLDTIARQELLEAIDHIERAALAQYLPEHVLQLRATLELQREYAGRVQGIVTGTASAIDFERCQTNETLLTDNPFIDETLRNAYYEARKQRSLYPKFQEALRAGNLESAGSILKGQLQHSTLVTSAERAEYDRRLQEDERRRTQALAEADLSVAVKNNDPTLAERAYQRLTESGGTVPNTLVKQVQALRLLYAQQNHDHQLALAIALRDGAHLPAIAGVSDALEATWKAARDLCIVLLARHAGTHANDKMMAEAQRAYDELHKHAPGLIEGIEPPGGGKQRAPSRSAWHRKRT